nr:thioredoxin fold domain-containing protein [uncultured Capnocytophaga sp.]
MTRKIIALLAFVLVATATLEAQEIKWITFDQALAAQKKKPKKIFVDVYTSWCGPCKMLASNTFTNKDLVKYVNEHYYAVKFNGEGNEVVNYKGQKFENKAYDPALAERRNSTHPFTGYLQVQAYPTMVFLDEKGELITGITGYMSPTQLELYLKMFKNDDYKNIKSQQEFQIYQSKFKGTFKN